MQTSMPGGWGIADGRVGGEGQGSQRETGEHHQRGTRFGGWSRFEVEKEADAQHRHEHPADNKRRSHDPPKPAKRQPAGPVEGRVVDGMPAEAQQEVVLDDGECEG